MKRLILLLVAGVLILGLTAGMASALPAGAVEVEHWELNAAGGWDGPFTGSGLARCWSSDPILTGQECNRRDWLINVKMHASIAQWIEWTVTGTRWDWQVLKPGTYAADCITFTIKSNDDVWVDYNLFNDLTYESPGTSVIPTIATYYAFGPSVPLPGSSDWIRATVLNGHDDMIPDSEGLHAGVPFKLYNKIVVVECNSACEYQDDATVTLVLQNIKSWIDPDTGTWWV